MFSRTWNAAAFKSMKIWGFVGAKAKNDGYFGYRAFLVRDRVPHRSRGQPMSKKRIAMRVLEYDTLRVCKVKRSSPT
jgi:hypothetical protein